MDNIRANLDVVFRYVSTQKIYDSIINKNEGKDIQFLHNNISERLFCSYSEKCFSHYTENEIQLIYKKMSDDMNYNGKKSVFNLIIKLADNILLTDDCYPICDYQHMLRWREVTLALGQDLFTTAFMAKRDILNGEKSSVFSWNQIIKSNNNRLNKIFAKGLAENHYHLWGSAPIFPLVWSYMMNITSDINKMGLNLFNQLTFGDTKMVMDFNEQVKLAALIRMYLFKRIRNIENKDGDDLKDIKSSLSQKSINVSQKTEVLRYLYGYKIEIGKISKAYDYALEKGLSSSNYNQNLALVGERKFLYDCFTNIYSDLFSDEEQTLFYLYCVIKNKLISEFIQNNGRVGFENFQRYNKRKNVFEGDKLYEYIATKLCIAAPIIEQNVISLEARISPNENPLKLLNTVNEIDEISENMHNENPLKLLHLGNEIYQILRNEDLEYNIVSKSYFVLHFIKERDNEKSDNNTYPKPRNYIARKKSENQAYAIASLLENNNQIRKRILGIDAASNEIGCRPEVFGSVFRYLKNFNPYNRTDCFSKEKNPVKLGLTYHAGEDFLDIVDGLRAIDEAILFCNLGIGDRLGHALALGIDPKDYYDLKNYTLIMTKQDMLDNVVWLKMKANELNISIEQKLDNWFCNTFNELFNEIYGEFIGSFEYRIQPSISCYYSAWKLRGDEPSLYITGSYKKLLYENTQYKKQMTNRMVAEEYYRKDDTITALYYAYHYNQIARKNGAKTKEFIVPVGYVFLVNQVATKMQYEIARKGIAIETNPSSNALIGTFKRYDKHPLSIWNDIGLNSKEQKQKSPELCVSINTDDQGVFETSLQNEYLLMARALEKKVDCNGDLLYSASEVYNWLDNIREMGIEQSFRP